MPFKYTSFIFLHLLKFSSKVCYLYFILSVDDMQNESKEGKDKDIGDLLGTSHPICI